MVLPAALSIILILALVLSLSLNYLQNKDKKDLLLDKIEAESALSRVELRVTQEKEIAEKYARELNLVKEVVDCKQKIIVFSDYYIKLLKQNWNKYLVVLEEEDPPALRLSYNKEEKQYTAFRYAKTDDLTTKVKFDVKLDSLPNENFDFVDTQLTYPQLEIPKHILVAMENEVN